MFVDVGDAKMKPLRVTFLVGTFSERLFTNLAIDRSTRQVSGRDIRGVVADDVARIKVGGDKGRGEREYSFL